MSQGQDYSRWFTEWPSTHRLAVALHPRRGEDDRAVDVDEKRHGGGAGGRCQQRDLRVGQTGAQRADRRRRHEHVAEVVEANGQQLADPPPGVGSRRVGHDVDGAQRHAQDATSIGSRERMKRAASARSAQRASGARMGESFHSVSLPTSRRTERQPAR